MILRKCSLSVGWYPSFAEKIKEFLKNETKTVKRGTAAACLVPHAGWAYSGAIAASGMAQLDPAIETVVVIGGHLPAGHPPLFAFEDGVETSLGPLLFDTELREILMNQYRFCEDVYKDNSVEVLIPMVKYFFPQARMLWLRLPADMSSFDMGKKLKQAALRLKRPLAVIASSDLTHYGYHYGFSPKGQGEAAYNWVREVNDAAFIEAALNGNSGDVLKQAEQNKSACSAGAVLALLGYVSFSQTKAVLINYGTSADKEGGNIPDSFVGYAACAWKSLT